jgi:hypothetical protein
MLKIQWKNKGETRWGHYEKRNALPKMETMRQRRSGHYENKMPSLLPNKKICFIRLLPNTLNKFW